MSSPVEFRHFLRLFTLDDARAGLQPVRIDGQVFAPPALQYRYKERYPTTNGDGTVTGSEVVWNEWVDVPYVRDGVPFNVGDVPVTTETVRQ